MSIANTHHLIVAMNGLKVLTVSPSTSKSHFAIGHAISKTLLDADHEIKMLSPYPLKNPYNNYTDISIAKAIESVYTGDDNGFFNVK